VYEIRFYVTANGKGIFADWLTGLRDSRARAAIIRRMGRVEQGNFGDHKYLRDGVSELRIDFGPGYRAYYAVEGHQVVLLLHGGDKRTQSADIDRACDYWKDWQNRLKEADHETE
jgi:putative addiction module killer protein